MQAKVVREGAVTIDNKAATGSKYIIESAAHLTLHIIVHLYAQNCLSCV